VTFSGIITVTTDFGSRDGYVGAMKGVILRTNPSLRVIDISHDIPAQDIDHASHVLATSAPHFPTGTVHLVVVDPGVGTDRGVLVGEFAGQHVVAPDNGLVTELWRGSKTRVCHQVPEHLWPESAISATFHGRDVFAPIAALLASGRFDLGACGAPVHPVHRQPARRERTSQHVIGEVVGSDRFGNARTSLREEDVQFDQPCVDLEGYGAVPWVRTYAEAPEGALVALIGSSGWVEIAVVGGNAIATLRKGQTVCVSGHREEGLVV